MILFLHHRYRTLGGEERVVDDLAWLVREHLGEDAEVLTRDSRATGAARAAAGLLRGGLRAGDVAAAVRLTGARVVHAHNLHPTFGWRALAAARAAGARTVLHLHNYRLVCATATCFDARDEDCTRCQGRNTLPGVRLNCRRAGRVEAATYALALSAWQRRLVAVADAVVVPSPAARDRLLALHAPLPAGRTHVLGHVVRDFAAGSSAAGGRHALVAGRLAVEKGVEDAIAACGAEALPLVVAGDGPLADRLRATAPANVTFTGRVSAAELAELRAAAAVALVPTHAHETFGLAAVEAMAAGVPVVAMRRGALADLGDAVALVDPGDGAGFGAAARAHWGDTALGERGLAAARALAAPARVAARLADIYRS